MTSPPYPQPRQFQSCLRSCPPQSGQGPTRSEPRPCNLMPRRAISSSIRTERASAMPNVSCALTAAPPSARRSQSIRRDRGPRDEMAHRGRQVCRDRDSECYFETPWTGRNPLDKTKAGTRGEQAGGGNPCFLKLAKCAVRLLRGFFLEIKLRIVRR